MLVRLCRGPNLILIMSYDCYIWFGVKSIISCNGVEPPISFGCVGSRIAVDIAFKWPTLIEPWNVHQGPGHILRQTFWGSRWSLNVPLTHNVEKHIPYGWIFGFWGHLAAFTCHKMSKKGKYSQDCCTSTNTVKNLMRVRPLSLRINP